MILKMTSKCLKSDKFGSVWDEENEKWWFSIIDVVAVLTDNDYQTGRNYWKIVKKRLKDEGNEMVTNCNQLRMRGSRWQCDLPMSQIQSSSTVDSIHSKQKSGTIQTVACKSRK